MAAGELTLNVSVQAYQNTITELEGYANRLNQMIGEYESKRSEIDQIWRGAQAEKYKRGIQESIKNTNAALNVTRKHIDELKAIIAQLQLTEDLVDSKLDQAIGAVTTIFN